jgi:predicted nuclease of restriction endonuclease-like RecB superfamily
LVFTADNTAALAVARRHLIAPVTCDVQPRERDAVLQAFRRGEIWGLVSARVLNEGLDVPDADVAVMVSGSQGTREYLQRVGRVLRPRPGKKAIIYEFVVRDTTEDQAVTRRRQALETPSLIDRRQDLTGKPQHWWQRTLADPVHPSANARRQQLAATVLERHVASGRVQYRVHPREVRADLYRRSASTGLDRQACVRQTAQALGLTPRDVEDLMFQDFRSQRPVPVLPEHIAPHRLALDANLALAQGLVARASQVRIRLLGSAHRVVRAARLRGLICEVHAVPGPDGAMLTLSGPLALFRHTILYGRALASLVPTLRWCDDHHLEARCQWKGHQGVLHLDPRSPLPSSPPARRYDSKVEARFAREFGRAAPHWELIRDPTPLRAGKGLVFPDFALRHRQGQFPSRLLEIAGFWTPEYLERKLRRYRLADAPNLILAVDSQRDVSNGDLPAGASLVTFRRRLDPALILAVIEARSPKTSR